jgi:PIN domain nuclease of toxin-antitoxin system
MKVLLDTHAFLWWLAGDERLSIPAREVIGSLHNTVLVSAASAWEVSTKYRIGKLPGAREVALDMASCLASQNFVPIPITLEQAQQAGLLPGPHRDPFDRILIAQALDLAIPLISNETVFDTYGVSRIW